MVVADCKGSVVFMATGYNALSATTGEILHAASGGGDGNATNDLTREFDIEAQVMPIQTVAYYVRDGANGPSLWQRVGTNAPQELVEGVQNLQVRFGIDTNANFEADAYRTADAVNAANDWERVVSVELAVLVQSPLETGSERDGRTYDLLGTNFGPYNDRRQRAVFTTTVVLRNRTL
jgi:type IV pilus assembly protein PilW